LHTLTVFVLSLSFLIDESNFAKKLRLSLIQISTKRRRRTLICYYSQKDGFFQRPCFTRFKYLELYIVTIGSFIDLCIEFFYSTHLKFFVNGVLNSFHMNDFEHSRMLLMFFILGFIALLLKKTRLLLLPQEALCLIAATTFTAECLLFFFHSTCYKGAICPTRQSFSKLENLLSSEKADRKTIAGPSNFDVQLLQFLVHLQFSTQKRQLKDEFKGKKQQHKFFFWLINGGL
ncbi:hypothetical protein N665_0336s0022, partial [Sinapis alba]